MFLASPIHLRVKRSTAEGINTRGNGGAIPLSEEDAWLSQYFSTTTAQRGEEVGIGGGNAANADTAPMLSAAVAAAATEAGTPVGLGDHSTSHGICREEEGATTSDDDIVTIIMSYSDGIYGGASSSLLSDPSSPLPLPPPLSPTAAPTAASAASAVGTVIDWRSRVAHFRVSPRAPAKVQALLWPSAGVPFGPWLRSLELSCCSLYDAHLREGLGDVLFGGMRTVAMAPSSLAPLQHDAASVAGEAVGTADVNTCTVEPTLIEGFTADDVLTALAEELRGEGRGDSSYHHGNDHYHGGPGSGASSSSSLAALLPTFNTNLQVLNLRSCVGVDDDVMSSILCERPWCGGGGGSGGTDGKGLAGDTTTYSSRCSTSLPSQSYTYPIAAPTAPTSMSTKGFASLGAAVGESARAMVSRFAAAKGRRMIMEADEAVIVNDLREKLVGLLLIGGGSVASARSGSSSSSSPISPLPSMGISITSISSTMSRLRLTNPLYASLRELYLYGCLDVTDKTLLMLRPVAQLAVLNVYGCDELSDAGLQHLCPLVMTGAVGEEEHSADGVSAEAAEGVHYGGGNTSSGPPLFLFQSSPSARLRSVCDGVHKKDRYKSLSTIVKRVRGAVDGGAAAGGGEGTNENISSFVPPSSSSSSQKQQQLMDYYIAYPSGLQHLSYLCLDSCSRISSVGLSSLHHHSCHLQKLDLNGCRTVNDDGLYFIAKGMASLKWLRMSNCDGVTDVGIAALAGRLKELWYLRISYCPLVTGVGFGGEDVMAFLEEWGESGADDGAEDEEEEEGRRSALLSAHAQLAHLQSLLPPGLAIPRKMIRLVAALSSADGSSSSTSSSPSTSPSSSIQHATRGLFPALWEVGMDHCPSLSDEGAMVMALVLGKSLKEVDWSYCVPGLGAGDGSAKRVPTSSHTATMAMRGGSRMAMSTAMDSDYSDDDDYIYGAAGASCAVVPPPSITPPPAAMLPLSFIAFFMQQEHQRHEQHHSGGGGGIKSLYLIGHKYITDDAMLGVLVAPAAKGTDGADDGDCSDARRHRCGGFGPIYMASRSSPLTTGASSATALYTNAIDAANAASGCCGEEGAATTTAVPLPFSSPFFYRSLRDVDVSGTGLTREGVAALRLALSTADPDGRSGYRARVVYADEEEY